MFRSCKYCGRVHKEVYICKKKPVIKKKVDEAVRFRNTVAWKNMREKIKRRDNYFCQMCIRNLYETRRQYNFESLQVHHAVPINKDKRMSLDSSNLLTLCPMHHKKCDSGKIPYEKVKEIIDEQEKRDEA